MAADDRENGAPTVPRRPRVHFTPPSGWMNDPNGLVHVDGVWHLFYQHHPGSLLWGPMHWGHATSRDLVSWEHHPVALEPDHLGTAFSGSAVVDHDGVAGFGAGALVAFYTHFLEESPQSQGVAYSTDGGTTWHTYDQNPVLTAPGGLVDFRDPKVVRLPGRAREPWVMVVVAGEEVLFFRSRNLLDWRPAGRFGEAYGAHGAVWETPDLFRLPVEGTAGTRWVLSVSVQDGGPAGGSATQYFVGDFDGETFHCDDPPEVVRWVDHGADFYAPQSWSDVPGGRRVWLAWMSNWAYARDVPADTWRGVMTVPRELALVRRGGGPVLAQRPVPELTCPAEGDGSRRDVGVQPGSEVVLARTHPAVAVDVDLALPAGEATGLVLEVRRGGHTAVRVAYASATGVLAVEPAQRGLPAGCRADRQEAVVAPAGDVLGLRLVVDTCSVELFAAGGTAVFTNQVFVDGDETEVALRADAAPVRLSRMAVRPLPVPR